MEKFATKNIERLLILVDAGGAENLELAIQLSTNLPEEWHWLHKYLLAKKELPPSYPSWYAVFSSVIAHSGTYQRVFFEENGVERDLGDVRENVANELHYLFFRLDREKLGYETVNIEACFRRSHQEINDNAVIKLARQVIRMLP